MMSKLLRLGQKEGKIMEVLTGYIQSPFLYLKDLPFSVSWSFRRQSVYGLLSKRGIMCQAQETSLDSLGNMG